MSQIITTYWTNFAKTGDPNGVGLPKWPAYNARSSQAMYFLAGTAQGGPVVNEEGLKTLDADFEWRRTTGADTGSGSTPARGTPENGPAFGEPCPARLLSRLKTLHQKSSA